MAYGSIPSIGALRYLVTLATRVSTPDGLGGISESFVNPIQLWADLVPVGLEAFIGGAEIGIPITHRCWFRFQEGLDMFDVILRQITLPSGNTRQEVFRIRRLADWNGRQRFTVAEVELEKRLDA